MRMHSQYCPICETSKIFVKKLKRPADGYCTEMEDVCQTCNTKFYVKQDKRIKI